MTRNAKYIIIAIAILVFAWLAVGVARAAPLTHADNGVYYDPNKDGQGLNLFVLPSGDIFASLGIGAVEGRYIDPVSLTAQGPQVYDADGGFELPVYETIGPVFGEAYQGVTYRRIGFARIYPRGAGTDTPTLRVYVEFPYELVFSPDPQRPFAADTFQMVRLVR